MTDEKFIFLEDSKNKKRTARSARNKVGKGGKRVRFPSDYMTKKELENMNSDVKTYDLTQPMKWADFKAMPDDLHKAYLLRIRNLYAAPASQIAEMFGVNGQTVINEQTRLGIPSLPKGVRANPEFANFAKFGTPVNSGFTKVDISRLEDLVSPEVKAKLAQYEKEHPPRRHCQGRKHHAYRHSHRGFQQLPGEHPPQQTLRQGLRQPQLCVRLCSCFESHIRHRH